MWKSFPWDTVNCPAAVIFMDQEMEQDLSPPAFAAIFPNFSFLSFSPCGLVFRPGRDERCSGGRDQAAKLPNACHVAEAMP